MSAGLMITVITLVKKVEDNKGNGVKSIMSAIVYVY